MLGGATSVLLTKGRVSWQYVCARMLEEYETSNSSGPSMEKGDLSKQAHSAEVSQRKRKIKSYYCKKLDHIRKD